jgi:ABC-2 type transport system permease protein
MAMVGVSAVTCQLSSSGRGALGWAGAFLGWAFVWQGVGNITGTVDADGLRVTSAWPTWLSPLGWGQQMRPYGGDSLWPLGLFAVLLVGLLALAVELVGHRDLGRGLLPDRRGRPRAPAALLSPRGLSSRLQRGALIGWMVTMVGFGVVFGGLTEQISDVTGSAREWYSQVGGSDQIVDAYQASIIEFIGMAVAAYAVQALLRLHTDEHGGTLEPLLATGTSRWGWLAGHLASTLIGSVALLLTFAVTMGLVTGVAMGGPRGQVVTLVTAALAQLPAVSVLGAMAVAVVGLAPRWSVPVCWSMLVATVILSPFFAPSVNAPEWLRRVSPFTHGPRIPATDVDWLSLGLLVATAVAVTAAGAMVLRTRDLRLPA